MASTKMGEHVDARDERRRSAGVLDSAVDTVLDRSIVGGYSRLGYALRRRLPGWPADPPAGALSGRVAAVTGANSGLGKATAIGLARLGADVHLVVRDVGMGESAAAELSAAVPDASVSVWRCDVSDLDDVERFATEYAGAVPRLDVLVHNAGVLPEQRTESVQGHELTLATHVLGPLRMTDRSLPVLAASGSARVILIASGGMYTQRLPADDVEYRDGEYRGATAYARTKRIQVALLPVLAQRWAAADVAVYGMHPGWADTPGVASSLPGFHKITGPLLRDAEQGADTTVWLAGTEPRPSSGILWHDRRPRSPHYLPRTRHSEAERWAVWVECAASAGIDV